MVSCLKWARKKLFSNIQQSICFGVYSEKLADGTHKGHLYCFSWYKQRFYFATIKTNTNGNIAVISNKNKILKVINEQQSHGRINTAVVVTRK